jgi:hypothetical protein
VHRTASHPSGLAEYHERPWGALPAARPPPRAKHTAIFTVAAARRREAAGARAPVLPTMNTPLGKIIVGRVLRDIGLVVRGSSVRRMPEAARVSGTADRIVGPLRRPPPFVDAVSWSCGRSQAFWRGRGRGRWADVVNRADGGREIAVRSFPCSSRRSDRGYLRSRSTGRASAESPRTIGYRYSTIGARRQCAYHHR